MTKKLKQHAPGFHSTESELDKPRLGDVRVEEGLARDPESGEVLSAVYKLPSGEHVRPRAMGPDFRLPEDAELVSPDRRGFKVYVFQDRPDDGEFGFFIHKDNTPDFPGQFDKQGFAIGADGKRVQRFKDRQAFIPVGEYPDEDRALKAAEKHVG